MSDAGPKLREVLLEAMTGPLLPRAAAEPFRHQRVDGVPFALTRYDQAGRAHLAAAFVDAGALDAALQRPCAHRRRIALRRTGDRRLLRPYARRPDARRARRGIRRPGGRGRAAGHVLRVVIALCEPARGRGMSAVDVFTFRPRLERRLAEDESLRGPPPDDGRAAAPVAAGRVRARAPAVGRGRLPAAGYRPRQPRRRAPVRCRRGARPHARARRRRARRRAARARAHARRGARGHPARAGPPPGAREAPLEPRDALRLAADRRAAGGDRRA